MSKAKLILLSHPPDSVLIVKKFTNSDRVCLHKIKQCFNFVPKILVAEENKPSNVLIYRGCSVISGEPLIGKNLFSSLCSHLSFDDGDDEENDKAGVDHHRGLRHMH